MSEWLTGRWGNTSVGVSSCTCAFYLSLEIVACKRNAWGISKQPELPSDQWCNMLTAFASRWNSFPTGISGLFNWLSIRFLSFLISCLHVRSYQWPSLPFEDSTDYYVVHTRWFLVQLTFCFKLRNRNSTVCVKMPEIVMHSTDTNTNKYLSICQQQDMACLLKVSTFIYRHSIKCSEHNASPQAVTPI